MAKPPRLRPDGEPDRRGRSEGSRATQFAANDGRRRPGRPKGAKSLRTMYRAAGEGKIPVTIGGRTLKLTKAEAIILKQVDLALKGHQRPAELFLSKFEQYSPVDVEPDLTAALLSEDREILESAERRGLIEPARDGHPTAEEGDFDNQPQDDEKGQ